MNMAIRPTDALAALGFTQLESEIYAFLLKESPSTGYRVAQAIGKAAANTYKGLETLERKGAITVEGVKTRLYRPVEVERVITRLESDFMQKAASATKALQSIKSVSGGKKDPSVVPTITDATTLYAELNRMIEHAGESVVLIASADHFRQVKDSILNAVSGGKEVYVLSDQRLNLGADAASLIAGEDSVTGCALCVDANSVALVSGDPHEPIGQLYSGHPITEHLVKGLLGRVALALVHQTLEEDGSRKQIRAIVEAAL